MDSVNKVVAVLLATISDQRGVIGGTAAIAVSTCTTFCIFWTVNPLVSLSWAET